MANLREVAHRVFAAEFNAGRVELKGTDERAPSYVLTPLGAKVNRIHVVGVLMEREATGPDGSMWRARVSDPTGVHTIYAGQYQPEASQALAEIEPPAYVAVVGKARTYEPEPGQLYVSIRPESVTVVEEDQRNRWVLEAAQATWARLRAQREAQDLAEPTPADLERLGVEPWVAEGVALARQHYQDDVDVDFFLRGTVDALRFLQSGEPIPQAPPAAPQTAPARPKAEGPGAQVEDAVLSVIRGFAEANEKGAPWDEVVAEGQKQKLNEDTVEEAINALMDKGLVYEPILGRLKVT